MDWRLILDYVRTLIWPTVTLALGIIFRKQLAKLTQRLDSVETPVGTVTFATQAENIAEEAASIKSEIAAEIQEAEEQDNKPEEEMEQTDPVSARIRQMPVGDARHNRRFSELTILAAADPTAAVLGAWRELEVAASSTTRSRISRQTGIVRAISDSGMLPEHLMRLTSDLMLLRNRVAHADDVSLNVEDAKAYVAAAQTVADALEIAQTPQARHIRYERAVHGALLSLGIPVDVLKLDTWGLDFMAGGDEGRVGIIVKHRHRTLVKSSLAALKETYKPSQVPKLVITNAPLSEEVSEFNRQLDPKETSIREVVQWRNQDDDDFLIRALLRAGVSF